MFDAAIWRALNPACSIEEEKPLVAKVKYRLNKRDKEEQILSLKEDGYCMIPSLVDPKRVDEMMACVQVLLDKGIPPVYAFVYDIFWESIARSRDTPCPTAMWLMRISSMRRGCRLCFRSGFPLSMCRRRAPASICFRGRAIPSIPIRR